MMKFAVAYLWEDFPQYDRVEQQGRTIKYYNKNVLIAEGSIESWGVNRQSSLTLDFVEADNTEDARKKIIEKVPKHILSLLASAIPL